MTNLERMISEIVLRNTATVLEGAHPSRIEAVAAPLAEAVVDLVISQGSAKDPVIPIKSALVFFLWNDILDLIEKEIPAAGYIEVKLTVELTRKDRRDYSSGKWREKIHRPYPPTE